VTTIGQMVERRWTGRSGRFAAHAPCRSLWA